MADSVDELFPEPMADIETPEDPQPVEPPEVVEEPTPEPEPAPEPEPEHVEPKEEEPRVIPLATALNWRDEAKESKRREAELERRIAEIEARNRSAETTAPDPFDDPAGFAAYQDQKIEQRMMEERFALSNTVALQQHGAETVQAAVQWAQERAQQDPMFAGSYMRQQHPIDWIVQQHKRDADLSDYQKDPVAFARRILEANGQLSAPATAPAVVVPTPASPPAKVPRSLASQGTAPSDVRQTATGPLVGVDALFG